MLPAQGYRIEGVAGGTVRGGAACSVITAANSTLEVLGSPAELVSKPIVARLGARGSGSGTPGREHGEAFGEGSVVSPVPTLATSGAARFHWNAFKCTAVPGAGKVAISKQSIYN
jgi:hypothetical protein